MMADDIGKQDFNNGAAAKNGNRNRSGEDRAGGNANPNADLRERGDVDDVVEAVIQGDAETAVREVGLRSDSPLDLSREEQIERSEAPVQQEDASQAEDRRIAEQMAETESSPVEAARFVQQSPRADVQTGKDAPAHSGETVQADEAAVAKQGQAGEAAAEAAQVAVDLPPIAPAPFVPPVDGVATEQPVQGFAPSRSAGPEVAAPAAGPDVARSIKAGEFSSSAPRGLAKGHDNSSAEPAVFSDKFEAAPEPAFSPPGNGFGIDGMAPVRTRGVVQDVSVEAGPEVMVPPETNNGTGQGNGGVGNGAGQGATNGNAGNNGNGQGNNGQGNGNGGSADAGTGDTGSATTDPVETQPGNSGNAGNNGNGNGQGNGNDAGGSADAGAGDTGGATSGQVLDGGNGKDVLDGGENNDLLSGGNGKDTLNGGAGDDVLEGGNGNDTFVFEQDFGNDVVTDFRPGSDQLDLSGIGMPDFESVLQNAVMEGDDTVITTDQGVLTLSGVGIDDLSPDDFVFDTAPETTDADQDDAGQDNGASDDDDRNDDNDDDDQAESGEEIAATDSQPDSDSNAGGNGNGGSADAGAGDAGAGDAGGATTDPVADETPVETQPGNSGNAGNNGNGNGQGNTGNNGNGNGGSTDAGAGDTGGATTDPVVDETPVETQPGNSGNAGNNGNGNGQGNGNGNGSSTDAGAGDTGGAATDPVVDETPAETQPGNSGNAGNNGNGNGQGNAGNNGNGQGNNGQGNGNGGSADAGTGDTGGATTDPVVDETPVETQPGNSGNAGNNGNGQSNNGQGNGNGGSADAGAGGTGGATADPVVDETPVETQPGNSGNASNNGNGNGGSADAGAGDTGGATSDPVADPPAPTIEGDSGANEISGGAGDDIVHAGSGDDRVDGGTGNDVVDAGSGNDRVYGGSGDDNLSGGDGTDRLSGGDGSDVLDGGAGTDRVYGGDGSDVLGGGEGNDRLYGGSGDDIVDGGAGDDYLKGDSGADTFKFEGDFGDDYVRDFQTGQGDTIDLSATEIGDFRSLVDHAHQDGNNTVIELDGGSLTLRDVDLGDLSADDFVLSDTAASSGAAPGSAHEIPDMPAFDALDPQADGGNGVAVDAMTLGSDQTVTMTFQSESAGYRSSVGHYTVDENGVIQNVEMAWENASEEGSGGDLVGGENQVSFDVDAGARVGVFIVPNGESKNNYEDLTDGHYEFRNDAGEPATINAVNPSLVFVHDDGNETTIDSQSGSIFHSAGTNLNSDGMEHSLSGVDADGNLTIGFEDLVGGGDSDFRDVVVKVEFEAVPEAAPEAAPAAFADGSGSTAAGDMETMPFDFVGDEEASGETVFNLDFSDLIPEGATEGQFEVRAGGLPGEVSASKGDVDSDRNWTLTMMQVLGLTIAVPTAASAADLLEDVAFEIFDTDSGEVIARGLLDTEALENGDTTISVLPQIDGDAAADGNGRGKGQEKKAEKDAEAAAKKEGEEQDPTAPVEDLNDVSHGNGGGPAAPAAPVVPVAVEAVAAPEVVDTVVEEAAADEESAAAPAVSHDSVIEVNTAPSDLTISASPIAENALNGAVVGTVRATDGDSGETFTYVLTDDAGGRFAIDASTGEVTVANTSLLDFETAASHDVTVRVTDSAGNSYVEVMTLDIADGNDTPTDLSITASTVVENVANGTVVGTVSATDPDAGETFAYTLADDAGGRFAINASTGVVTVANGALLDFETAASHNVTVRVTDSGGNTYDEVMALNVTDTNDAPTDLAISASAVAENVANGTVVGTVSSTDQDAGETFTYSLTDDAGGRFSIDGATGVVTVADGTQLNYESATSHDLTVRVTDSGGETYDEVMTINVTDVNEAPTAASMLTFVVGETTWWNGLEIGGVTGVTDPDAGETYTYSLIDDAYGRFTINAAGKLVIADADRLDYEDQTSHSVTIRITDSGGNTFDRVHTVHLYNENEPPTNLSLSAVEVNEGSANGAIVATAAATDVDAGDTFTYSLTNNAGGRFAIDGATGVVTVVDGSLLDYETATSHDITVRVTDSGGATYDETYTIGVNDVNEHADTYVAEVTAHDPVGYWRMDEVFGSGSSHTMAAEVGGVDATMENTDTGTENNAFGGISAAMTDFWGDDYMVVPDDAAWQLTDGTVQLVFKPEDISGQHVLVSRDSLNSNEGDFKVYLDDDDIVVTLRGTGGGTLTASNAVSSHSWYQIDVTFGSGGLEIWLNGTRIANDPSITGGVDGTTEPWVIGASSSNTTTGDYISDNAQWESDLGGYFNGDIGEFAIFDSQLGSAAINDMYDAGVNGEDLQTLTAGNDSDSGSTGVDMIDGGAGNDTLAGHNGDDFLYGGDGDDIIDGGSHDDVMSGGLGNDTAQYSGFGSGVTVNLETGVATDGGGGTDTLSGFENVLGTNAADTITGNDADNVLTGNGGNDFLYGRDGEDTLYGGAGDDTLSGESGDDLLQGGAGDDILSGGAGTDTVTYAGEASGVTANLATGTATDGSGDTDTLSGIENLIGTSNNDTFTGDNNANVLTGGDGSDRFIIGEGGSGMDTVQGGAGGGWTDTLQLMNSDSSSVGGGWTVQLTSGSVQTDDGATMTLTDDAAGTVTLEDGSQIAFDNLEKIEY